jgi:tetratricopeptide (TPR) repeat protein
MLVIGLMIVLLGHPGLCSSSGEWVDTLDRARTLEEAHQFSESEKEFRKAVQIALKDGKADPRYSESLHNLGEFYRKRKRWYRAQRCFEEELAILAPLGEFYIGRVEPLFMLNVALREQGHWDKALDPLSEAIAIIDRRKCDVSPGRQQLLTDLGAMQMTLGRDTKAIVALTAAMNEPDWAKSENQCRIYKLLGDCYAHQKKDKQAVQQYERALAILRSSGVANPLVECDILRNLVNCLVRQGRTPEAENGAKRIIALSVYCSGPEQKVDAVFSAAAVLARLGKLEDANEGYRAALQSIQKADDFDRSRFEQNLRRLHGIDRLSREICSHPTRADLYLLRGRTYRDLIDYRNALADYEKAIAINPHLSRVHAFYAESLILSLQAERGIEECNRGLEEDPNDWWLYDMRAGAKDLLGNPEAALVDLSFVLSHGTVASKIPAYQHRAGIYQRLHRYPEALQDLNKCIDAHPQEAELYNLRAKLLEDTGAARQAKEDYHRALALERKGN